jgi:flagellar M-ring protein FliF
LADIDEPKSMNPDSGAASVNLSSSNSGAIDIGATQTPPKTGWELAKSRFEKLDFNQKLGLGAAATFLVVVLLAISISSSKSDYRVLFSNINEADGSQIIASLTQMNVPYKFTPGGGAILVPEKMVYETRLKLAGQGLPKSGYVGFEVLENQKLGTSQFVEQVNYQRAVEGELARSIGSISQIKSARVHLAVPKQTAFVREQDRPTASVVLQMYPGRFLEPQQVIAIQHLVSSSIPKLAPSQVTVVDQDGILLSQSSQRMETLDSSQLKYVAELENALAKRVSMLMDPIAGKDSVRAQVTVDMNFDERTRTEETFGKNSAPNAASVRSQQNMDSSGSPGGARGASPGALTNQPPPQPTAPLTGPLAADNEARQLSAPSSASGGDAAERRESTINYEVDRAIEVLKANKGQVKRVSAAVVVNYKPAIVKNGVVETPAAPYSPEELQQMTNIIRDAVGYNEKRGDTVSVANIPFAAEAVEVLPFYRQPEMIELGKELLKYGLVLIAILLLYRSVRNLFKPEEPVIVAPVIEAVIEPEPEPEPVPEDPAIVAAREAAELERIRMEQEKERIAKLEKDYEELSAYTIEYVKNNPQVIGTLLKNWRVPKREENTPESNAPLNGFKPEGFA